MSQFEEEDYYEILKVSDTSTFEEIKKSYRKLALKYHPDKSTTDSDKSTNEKIFQKITMAYQTLSDDSARKEYDHKKKYGESQGFNNGNGNGNGFYYQDNAEDDFPNFFHDFHTGSRNSGYQNQKTYPIHPINDFIPKVNKGTTSPDAIIPLPVSLKSLYIGNTISITIDRKKVCVKCSGSKISRVFLEKIVHQRSKILDCPSCHGHGVFIVSNGFFEYEVPCEKCFKLGVQIPKKAMCGKCDTKGYTTESMDVPVFVQSGMKDKDTIVLKGKADEKIGCEFAGDAIFRIKELPDSQRPDVKRIGNDIYSELSISLLESLTGLKNYPVFKTFDNRILLFSTARGKVLRPNSFLKIKGQGWPNSNGDLYLKITVEFPPDNWYSELNDLKKLQTYLPMEKDAHVNKLKNGFNSQILNHQVVKEYEYLDDDQISREIKEKVDPLSKIVYQEDESDKKGYCSQQ